LRGGFRVPTKQRPALNIPAGSAAS